jgi:hypothetical protein
MTSVQLCDLLWKEVLSWVGITASITGKALILVYEGIPVYGITVYIEYIYIPVYSWSAVYRPLYGILVYTVKRYIFSRLYRICRVLRTTLYGGTVVETEMHPLRTNTLLPLF